MQEAFARLIVRIVVSHAAVSRLLRGLCSRSIEAGRICRHDSNSLSDNRGVTAGRASELDEGELTKTRKSWYPDAEAPLPATSFVDAEK
jgi:hypothetical protein